MTITEATRRAMAEGKNIARRAVEPGRGRPDLRSVGGHGRLV